MKMFSALILVMGVPLLGSCEKKVCLDQDLTSEEIIQSYQTQARSPVSASFQATSAKGFFQGELYVEKQEKLQAIVYGYLSIGQPLFQLAMDGDSFLYLDFQNATAYSNRKDWLKDFKTASFLPNKQEFHFLALSLRALAGEIPVSSENFELNCYRLKVAEQLNPETPIEYLFKKEPLRIIEIRQSGEIFFSADFSYQENCWFPTQIRAKTVEPRRAVANEEFNLQINLSRLNCAEKQRPEISFSAPAGFRQIFISE